MATAAVFADVETTAAHQQVRIPKLAVRNRTTIENGDGSARPVTATTVATEASSENGGQAQSNSSSSLRAPSPEEQRRLSDQSGSASSGLARRDLERERSMAQKPKEAAKKKKKGMLGFLTMKEPSAMALEEFAEAQKKKAQERGSSVVNVAGVSTRKLPEHVPKVNSKWDGLPENAKKQSAETKSVRSRGDSNATSGRRPSTYSSWSNRSDEGKRPIGTLSSRPPQSPQLPQRTSLQSRGTVSSTHSARAPILNNDVHPAFRPIAVEETPENLPQTFLYPPSPPRQQGRPMIPQRSPKRQQNFAQELPASFGAVPELDTSDGPLPELESSLAAQEMDALRSKDATPVPKSPITPSVDDAGAANYYSDSIVGAIGDDRTTFLHSQSDTDHEDFARSSTPKQLRQPINFSRRRSGKAGPPPLGKLPEAAPSGFTFLAEEQPVMSPTLKNSEGRIDPFLTDTFAAQSRETGRIDAHPPPRTPTATAPQHATQPSVDEHPLRASTSTSGVHSPVFSTAPTDSTRPFTAACHDDDAPDAYYTTHLSPSHRLCLNSADSLDPSLAPSTMSAQWALTPKERLGLGSRIRKGEVLPWETAEDNAEISGGTSGGGGGSASGGLLTPPASGADGRFKRLSYRWGGGGRR